MAKSRTTGARSADQKSVSAQRIDWAAELPAGRWGTLARLELQFSREGDRGNGRVHLRAHLKAQLGTVGRHAAEQLLREAVGLRHPLIALGRRRLERIAQRWLADDLQSWLEIKGSTADLHEGARALLPDSDGLRAMGVVPGAAAAARDSRHEHWQGRRGSERVGIHYLRLERDDWPKGLCDALGVSPMNLIFTLVNNTTRRSDSR